jgi:hypothetical protein
MQLSFSVEKNVGDKTKCSLITLFPEISNLELWLVTFSGLVSYFFSKQSIVSPFCMALLLCCASTLSVFTAVNLTCSLQ